MPVTIQIQSVTLTSLRKETPMRSGFIAHVALAFTLALTLFTSNLKAETDQGGFVYVMTNRAEGNSVLVFRRLKRSTPARAGCSDQRLGNRF